jgi:hypothetical protein
LSHTQDFVDYLKAYTQKDITVIEAALADQGHTSLPWQGAGLAQSIDE